MRKNIIGISTVLLLLFLFGCSKDNDKLIQFNTKEKYVVKVLYESESAFFTNYGALLSAKYPNLEFDVIPLPNTSNLSNREEIQVAYDKVINEQQPDILFLFPDQLERYGSLGQLYNLDSLISQDGFDIDNMLPAITDYIRSIGSGKLYGLTPNFYGMGVYYNKDIFDKYQIPYPTDTMSWEELMLLAQRFSPDSTSSYGIRFGSNHNSLFQLALNIGTNNNLKFLDVQNKKITISTFSWKEIFEFVFDTYQANSMYQLTEDDHSKPGMTHQDLLLQNPFITNEVAMTVEGNYFMNDLKLVEKLDSQSAPKWDVVALPSNSNELSSEDSIWIQYILAINSKSTNKQTAWEVIKYINSEEFTRVTLKSTLNNSLPSRRNSLLDGQHNVDAFYKLRINPYVSKNSLKLPADFFESFNSFANLQISEAYQGNITLDEALASIEEKGQELLSTSKD
ncbi:multiple sugar transport system substrate-binding protein [Fontibacillus solani]|uniref:Multiple sugar transport system substrate-binding protein n=1 Tax=Fontibacillus solani TaxID=1572857 RepID=A0A7W3SPJ9_9BACL|nr:extracellular solute-binding protein [Fontibacillus solani]MBA9083878.1 multiple sugar transport system substrate-binding protein [Fontibacillus solani]